MWTKKPYNYYGSDISVSLVHTKLEKMLSITIYKLLNVVIQEKTSLKVHLEGGIDSVASKNVFSQFDLFLFHWCLCV